jgi:hypothetical protein
VPAGPTQSPPPEGRRESRAAGRDDSLPAGFFYRVALVQVIGNLAGSLVTSLLFGVAIVVALRRTRPHGRRSDPTLLTIPSPPTEASVREEPEEPVRRAAPAPTEVAGVSPTYPEGRRPGEEEALRQEEAMLRQLFQQNLHLRRQLAELEAAGTR